MLQGISLKKESKRGKKREKRKTRGDQASLSNAHCFYFQKGLLYLYLYIEGNERCKVIQFSSVAQLCPTLCDPMNRSTPGLPVQHQLPELLSLVSVFLLLLECLLHEG